MKALGEYLTSEEDDLRNKGTCHSIVCAVSMTFCKAWSFWLSLWANVPWINLISSLVRPIPLRDFQLKSPRLSQCSCRVLRVQVGRHRNNHSCPQGHSRDYSHPDVIPRQRYRHLRCVSCVFLDFLHLIPTHMQDLCSCENASTGPGATSHCLIYL